MSINKELVRQQFAKRLSIALDHSNIESGRKRRLIIAKLFGISRESVRKWLSAEAIPSTTKIPKLAKALNVTAEWLLTGNGVMDASKAKATSAHKVSESHVEDYHDVIHRIPIIDWKQVKTIKTNKTLSSNKHIVTSGNVSDLCYALAINNNDTAPKFPKQSIIIVDPNIPLQHKSHILIFLHASNCIAIKRFNSKRMLSLHCPNDVEKAMSMHDKDQYLGTIVQLIVNFI